MRSKWQKKKKEKPEQSLEMSMIRGEIDPLRVRRGNLGNVENQRKAVQPKEQSRLETCRVGPLPCSPWASDDLHTVLSKGLYSVPTIFTLKNRDPLMILEVVGVGVGGKLLKESMCIETHLPFY